METRKDLKFHISIYHFSVENFEVRETYMHFCHKITDDVIHDAQ